MFLENLRLFLHIVEKGSLAAGGREMGFAPATVSERLASLEAHYGARLLTRTTRSIHPTEEGRALLLGAQRILAETDELEARIRLGAERIAGPIRMSAPSDLGRNRVAPVIDRFLAAHPDVSVDLLLSDGYIDLPAMGLDLAVRYGDLADSALMVQRLAASPRVVCAAPSYLDRHGTPENPAALEGHNCLLMRFRTETDRSWPFLIDGLVLSVRVQGNRIANDGDVVRRWAVAGHGIVRKSLWDVTEDIRAGRLVPLLRPYEIAPLGIQVVWPGNRLQPRRVKALIEMLGLEFAVRTADLPRDFSSICDESPAN